MYELNLPFHCDEISIEEFFELFKRVSIFTLLWEQIETIQIAGKMMMIEILDHAYHKC